MTNLKTRWSTAVAATMAASVMVFLSPAPALHAGERYESDSLTESPIKTALAELPQDVRAYNDHITFLADPFCAGRLPGTHGMEVAMEYVEYYMEKAGLEPAFDGEGIGGPEKATTPWRQAFPLGGSTRITTEEMAIAKGASNTNLKAGEDFKVLSLGASGDIAAPVEFVGYSMAEGPDGSDYSNYEKETDLTGRIAMMFRFEPMNDEGQSRWSDGRWTSRAAFQGKINAAVSRGAAGVVIVNTPGADDPRVNSVTSAGGGQSSFKVPISIMSIEAAEQFAKTADPNGRSLLELRKYADEGGKAFAFKSNVLLRINAKIESKSLMGENVGGILRGRGNLADQFIVIGGHLDHLGMGDFGSRWGSGKLHPGADDNASGSAGVLLIADKLAREYAAQPDDANLRSILFLTFSGEESGLNGSRYYVNHPIVPLKQHVLMMNFDMIGRILNKRLSVSGAETGEGMADFLQPILDESELEIVQPAGMSGASDHSSFLQKEMPVLFAIIADFHGDYHTPEDVSWKINRVDAVKACNLWTNIALQSAKVPEFFKYKTAGRPSEPRGARSARSQIKVRFGIVPGNYDSKDETAGILVSDVTEKSSAANGGVKKGDRLVKWNGEDIKDISAWMGMLAKHKPGDVVNVTVLRDDVEVVLKVKLQGRDGDG